MKSDLTEMPSGSALQMPRTAVIFAALLLLAEIATIGIVFKHIIGFTCLDNWPQYACAGASGTLVQLGCALGALALLAVLMPQPFLRLVAEAGTRFWPIWINLAGTAIAMIPVLFLRDGAGTAVLAPALACWSLGMALLLAGLGVYLAPVARWAAFVGATWRTLVPVLMVGAMAPWLSAQIRPFWRMEALSELTFDAVTWLLTNMGFDVIADPVAKVIGDTTFSVRVAPQCSGIEGIALVTLFVSLYLWLFRHELRFPRVLLLYPIGLAASAAFNVVRIALLIAIGIKGNPDLAVGGFHSHAGWLMFTLVALGIVALAQTVPGIQKHRGPATAAGLTSAAPQPFFSDPLVARLLPFAIFMFSAQLAQVFAQTPGVVYPARAALMAGVLALFLPVYRALPWRIDPVAVGAGALIGLGWVLIPVPESSDTPYGALSGTLLVGWFVFRGLGTILLVPIVEELFFRGYLERLLKFGTSALWTLFAIVATSALFAALHDRWIEAFAAGLVLSWVMRRRGNLCDAIVAHATANAIVFGVAVLTGNLAII